MRWVGPYQVRSLLESGLKANAPCNPPDDPSVYLVSQFDWQSFPTIGCVPLYIGGITGESPRFRTRIGDLLADAFGFFNRERPQIGHHSGGQSIYCWCAAHDVSPFDLYIGWVKPGGCHRCLEVKLHCRWDAKLKKNGLRLLNKRTPPSCDNHA